MKQHVITAEWEPKPEDIAKYANNPDVSNRVIYISEPLGKQAANLRVAMLKTGSNPPSSVSVLVGTAPPKNSSAPVMIETWIQPGEPVQIKMA